MCGVPLPCGGLRGMEHLTFLNLKLIVRLIRPTILQSPSAHGPASGHLSLSNGENNPPWKSRRRRPKRWKLNFRAGCLLPALPLMTGKYVVAEVVASEPPEHDVGNIDNPGDFLRSPQADEKSAMVGKAHVLKIASKLGRRIRRRSPRTMKRAAVTNRCKKSMFVSQCGMSKAYTLAHLAI